MDLGQLMASKKDKNILAEITKIDGEDYTLKYLNGDEKIVKKGTLKRWWKPYEEFEYEVPPYQFSLYRKRKNSKRLKEKHDLTSHPLRLEIEKFADILGIDIVPSKNEKFLMLKMKGKQIGAFSLSYSSVTLWLKKVAVGELAPYKEYKHAYDARVTIYEVSDSTSALILKLLGAEKDYYLKKLKNLF